MHLVAAKLGTMQSHRGRRSSSFLGNVMGDDPPNNGIEQTSIYMDRSLHRVTTSMKRAVLWSQKLDSLEKNKDFTNYSSSTSATNCE